MFLRTLSLNGYGIFENAVFDLTTDVDRPIVLITGNNGAGKTSLLEGLRLALHGRRAFDSPVGEADYLRTMASRFYSGGEGKRAVISLDFDYLDLHQTRRVSVERSWSRKRQHVAEDLRVSVDGRPLMVEDADDFLTTIIPPEVARYFFFDGERIHELADWDADDESALFSAIGDLLGLGLLDQLRLDLVRLAATGGRSNRLVNDTADALAAAEDDARAAMASLKTVKGETRKVRANFERTRAEVRRVGALRQDELSEIQAELAELESERRSLLDEAQRAANDVLPLLCAKTLRARFGSEIEGRKAIEDRAIVSAFLEQHAAEILAIFRSNGLNAAAASTVTGALGAMARGTLVPVSDVSLPNVSRSDAVWMRRVIEHELPSISRRNETMIARLRFLNERISLLDERRRSVPLNDPAVEAALAELEQRQRGLIEHEAKVATCEAAFAEATKRLEAVRAVAKEQRFERFRAGRLRVREASITRVLEALPRLSEQLKSSKEKRFGHYLESALRNLWHKTDRLTGVEVSFAQQRIALLDRYGEINKRDLSEGEKQLFAVAFIHALSRLSGRHIPFVIDTPLGRLDHQHRRRLVADFIPNASHQVVLLSTDTEIVGSLYDEIRPLLAHHHELADYNGRATKPVQIASA